MPDYDLIDEKWIPCAMLDGEARSLGLREVLERAHEIREIADPSPLVTFGICRLLLAVVHWLRPIQTVQEWRSFWGDWHFPKSLTDDLLERGNGLFDLFDAQRPFYQDASIAIPSETRGKPVGALCLEVPLETNINHFHHVYDDGCAMCLACCARALVSLPPFAPRRTSQPPYPASVNGCPPVYALPQGLSLFHTLTLNLPVREVWESEWTALGGTDAPLWERQPESSGRTGAAIGFLEGLTWQPRQARLGTLGSVGARCTSCGEVTPVWVKRVAFGDHPATVGERSWVDPHVPLTAKNQKRMLPASARADAWCRQFESFLAPPEGAEDLRPPVLGQLGNLDAGDAMQELTLFAFEVDPASQGKTVNWHRTALSLPRCLISGSATGEAVRCELAVVRRMGEAVQKAVTQEQLRGKDRKGAAKRARDELSRLLWDFHAGAASAFLRAAQESLKPPPDFEGFRDTFRRSLRNLAGEVRERIALTNTREQRWRRSQYDADFGRVVDRVLAAEGGH